MPDEKELEELQETIDAARRRTGEAREGNGENEPAFLDRGENDDPDDVDNAIAPPG